jgi:hypothetical protein
MSTEKLFSDAVSAAKIEWYDYVWLNGMGVACFNMLS